jgi:glycine amidinotransferase/scyllo-inosamine-4-phosphate amidinotransferase 1
LSKIYSENEWDPLQEVIIGTADHANWPESDIDFKSSMTETCGWKETKFRFGPVSQEIVDRANLSLDKFSAVLGSLGVKVHRPLHRNYTALNQFYGYCPRDTVLVVGDTVIRTPTRYTSRRSEWETMSHVWDSHRLISPEDPAAVFDAANVCRLGQDLLYLVSETGNLAGARWLQDCLGKEYRVHVLDNLYSGVHIDSTIVPVREGLVVLNAGRVTNDNVPAALKDWDKIWISADELAFQPFDHYPYASNWIGLNFLMVNPNLAIVDPKQETLRKKLAQHGVDSIGVDLTESRTLGGGHHCCSLDTLRG